MKEGTIKQKKRLESIIYPELSYTLNGLFFKVRNELGIFCRELHYCDAVESPLKERNI
jgi:hypothetical protein